MTPDAMTLTDRVRHLWEGGDQIGALLAITRAIESLQADSHPPQEIAPRVEAVLEAWGYKPLPSS
jgi:hypothetical protein